MRKFKFLSLYLCLTLTVLAVDARNSPNNKDAVGETTIQNAFPNVFRPVENLIRQIIGRPRRYVCILRFANVTALTLSRNEVATSCMNNQIQCYSNSGIGIYTVAVDPENDVLTYVYTVSGGKIIGAGDKVVWDLAGEKPGVYTITAGVDDSCGVCGQTITKTATVAE